MKYLFVGGVADGESKEVPEELNTLIVPKLTPLFSKEPYSESRYVRAHIFGVEFFALDSFKAEDVIKKLLAGYVPSNIQHPGA